MAISSLNNNYPTQAYGFNQNEKTSSKEDTKKTEENNSELKKTTNNPYSQKKSTSWLQSAVSATIAGMGLGPTDNVTFSTIINYRDQLQKDFDSKVKEGLKKAGIDENINFQLVSGEDGGITVISDHEDKGKIEKFFSDNPELVKDFEKIQALNNVEAMRKEQRIDPNAVRQRIQIESMTAWFAGSGGNNVNAIMNYSEGTTSFTSGINKLI